MPIYEYRCAACGHELEALQKLSDSPLKDCPSCGQARLSKLVSAAGFRLKGSGWYATDFKNHSKPAEKSNGDGKSETTPATSDGATAKSSGGESTSSGEAKSGGESKSAGKAKSAAGESKPAGGGTKSESKPAAGGGGR